MAGGKVVFVSFKPRRPGTGPVFGRPRFLFGVFAAVALAEIVAAAVLLPRYVGTELFGPTVVVVAVVAALGADRLRWRAAGWSARRRADESDLNGAGGDRRTLH